MHVRNKKKCQQKESQRKRVEEKLEKIFMGVEEANNLFWDCTNYSVIAEKNRTEQKLVNE